MPDIFIRQAVDAGSKPTYAEKLRVPPPPPHWAETTNGRNDSRPKRPTKIGRVDSLQNLAETTHGRNDLDSFQLLKFQLSILSQHLRFSRYAALYIRKMFYSR